MGRVSGPDPTDPHYDPGDVAAADAQLRQGLAFATLVAADPWADMVAGLAAACARHRVVVSLTVTPLHAWDDAEPDAPAPEAEG